MVEKIIGDAVVGLFGATVATENDGERAVSAALRIVDEVRELEAPEDVPELQVRVGVATGEAIVQHPRPGGRRPRRGLGRRAQHRRPPAVRRARRPRPGRRRDLPDVPPPDRVRPSDPVIAKGKAEPVPAWLAVAGAVSTGALRDPGAPFVGRAEELGRLLATFANVRDGGRCARVAVIGEPGVGKSWLVSEATAGMVGGRVLWGRCLDYGAGMTYWPVAEMLRSAAQVRIADPPAEAAQLLRGLIDSLPTDDADVLHTIGAALATVAGGQTSTPGPYEAPSMGEDELRWGCCAPSSCSAGCSRSFWSSRTCTGPSRRCSSWCARCAPSTRRC